VNSSARALFPAKPFLQIQQPITRERSAIRRLLARLSRMRKVNSLDLGRPEDNSEGKAMDKDHYLFLEPDEAIYAVTKCKDGYEVFRMYVDRALGACSALVETFPRKMPQIFKVRAIR
jgi:hypothetical protein